MTLGASVRTDSSRLLTATNDCSWVFKVKAKKNEAEEDFLKREGIMDQIPLLFTIGAVPDAFDMIKAIDENYDPARSRQANWSLGFEWEKAHKVGNSITLFSAWFKAIADLRLSETGEIIAFDQSATWLGSRADWESPWPTVAPIESIPEEERADYVWLPSQSFAHTWRAYQSTGADFVLTGRNAQGETLPSPSPQKHRQWILDQDETIELGLKPSDAVESPSAELDGLTWFIGNTAIVEAEQGSLSAAWTPPGPGTYVVHAEWTGAKGKQSSKPILIVVKTPVQQKTIRIDHTAKKLPMP